MLQREHSEQQCSQISQCIVGLFSVPWKDSAVETAFKMFDSLISALLNWGTD